MPRSQEGTVKAEQQVIGENIGLTTLGDQGKISRANGKSRPRAVLFVPEGGEFDPDMEIQVIGINEEGMQALVARRC